MVLYNVTVSVSEESVNDWVKYMMEEHIPDVLATGHFRDFRLCHVQGEAQGGVTLLCNTWRAAWRRSRPTKRTTPMPFKPSTKANGAARPLGFAPCFR